MIVTADDTTGAMEAAARCADVGSTVEVWTLARWRDGHDARNPDSGSPSREFVPRPGSDPSEVRDARAPDVVVIDLRSRHLLPRPAVAALTRVLDDLGTSGIAASGREVGTPPRRHVHKIDSMLRGNWDVEVAELARRSSVTMIPAFPSAGRICRDGVVLADGVAVDEGPAADDPRRAPVTARPAEHLRAMGCRAVERVARETSDVLDESRHGFLVTVADASTDDDVDVAVAIAVDRGVAIVGTADVVGSVAARTNGRQRTRPACPPPRSSGVVVVAGSRHPVARRQLDRLRAAHASDPRVIVFTPADRALPGEPSGAPHAGATSPELVLEHLAASTWDACRDGWAVVAVGGDTAGAVVGDDVVDVQGSWDVGIAVGRLRDRGVSVVTKPGAFGDESVLVRLVGAMLGP